MLRTMFGNPESFAIELERELRIPLMGAVRIWVGGLWIGDIDNSMDLGSMCERLNSLRGPRREKSKLLFTDEHAAPDFNTLRGFGGWSFGEPFDDFECVYYAAARTRLIHWMWLADENWRIRHPDYPAGIYRGHARFDEYDHVVGALLSALEVPDDVTPGYQWIYDPRDSYRKRAK